MASRISRSDAFALRLRSDILGCFSPLSGVLPSHRAVTDIWTGSAGKGMDGCLRIKASVLSFNSFFTINEFCLVSDTDISRGTKISTCSGSNSSSPPLPLLQPSSMYFGDCRCHCARVICTLLGVVGALLRCFDRTLSLVSSLGFRTGDSGRRLEGEECDRVLSRVGIQGKHLSKPFIVADPTNREAGGKQLQTDQPKTYSQYNCTCTGTG